MEAAFGIRESQILFAKCYKKKYNERLQARKNLNRYDNQNYKIYIKLRIFREGYVHPEG